MGLIKAGILGAVNGKIGHVSGQRSKGKNVLMSKADMSNVIKSDSQVTNNDKFDVLRKLYMYSNERINKAFCANNIYKESGYNYFSRKNYSNLNVSNILSVNNIYVGNSSLSKVSILKAEYNAQKTHVIVTWNVSTFHSYGSNSLVSVLAYDATNIRLYSFEFGEVFLSGTCDITLQPYEGIDYNNLYFSVIVTSNTDNKKWSNTLNNWVLAVVGITDFTWLVNPFAFNMNNYEGHAIKDIDAVGFDFLSKFYSSSDSYICFTDSNKNLFLCPVFKSQFFNYSFTFNYISNNVSHTYNASMIKHNASNYSGISFPYTSRNIAVAGVSNSNFKTLFGATFNLSSIEYVSSNNAALTFVLSPSTLLVSVTRNSTGYGRCIVLTIKLTNDAVPYKFFYCQSY